MPYVAKMERCDGLGALKSAGSLSLGRHRGREVNVPATSEIRVYAERAILTSFLGIFIHREKFCLSKVLRTKHKTYKLIHPPMVSSLTSVPQTLLATRYFPSVSLLAPHCLTEEHFNKPQHLVKTLILNFEKPPIQFG